MSVLQALFSVREQRGSSADVHYLLCSLIMSGLHLLLCIQLRLRNEGGPVPPTSHVVPKATQAPPKVSAVSFHPISSSSAPAAGDAHNTVDENAPPEAEGLFKLLRTITIRNTIFATWEIMLLAETLVLSTYGENALAMLPFM